MPPIPAWAVMRIGAGGSRARIEDRMTQQRPTLRDWWAVPAAALGAVAVASVATLAELWLYWDLGDDMGGLVNVAAPYVLAMFGAGVVVVGLPAWAVLHLLGLRSAVHATIAGAVATLLGILLFAMLALRGDTLLSGGALELFLIGVLPGALGGLAFQRIAYAPPPVAKPRLA